MAAHYRPVEHSSGSDEEEALYLDKPTGISKESRSGRRGISRLAWLLVLLVVVALAAGGWMATSPNEGKSEYDKAQLGLARSWDPTARADLQGLVFPSEGDCQQQGPEPWNFARIPSAWTFGNPYTPFCSADALSSDSLTYPAIRVWAEGHPSSSAAPEQKIRAFGAGLCERCNPFATPSSSKNARTILLAQDPMAALQKVLVEALVAQGKDRAQVERELKSKAEGEGIPVRWNVEMLDRSGLH